MSQYYFYGYSTALVVNLLFGCNTDFHGWPSFLIHILYILSASVGFRKTSLSKSEKYFFIYNKKI